MNRWPILAFAALLALPGTASAAESVMVRCGQQYQAAKAAGTLDGQSWDQYRADCAARLKARPADAATSEPATPAPAPTTAPKPAAGGWAAMLIRRKQCGAEWHAQKTALTVQTPGLKWPTYWSQCNTRLKAAGQTGSHAR